MAGITNEMVAGHNIDIATLDARVESADLIIAHNAAFDRPFCEGLSPVFASKAWACSVTEIRWADLGFEGNKLGYLVGQSGLFHEPHIPVFDKSQRSDGTFSRSDFANDHARDLYPPIAEVDIDHLYQPIAWLA